MAKYQGNNFEEWYKANYGNNYNNANGLTRAEGMKDVDWDIGQRLYNSYLASQASDKQYQQLAQNNLDAYNRGNTALLNSKNAQLSALEREYGTAQNSLATGKKNAEQEQSILLDRMKKYLPSQMRMQGLGNSGFAETSLLNAYNNYSKNMGDISSQYESDKASLLNNYENKKAEAENTYATGMANLENTYNANNNAALLQQYAEQAKRYGDDLSDVNSILENYKKTGNDAFSAMMNTEFVDYNSLQASLDVYKDYLTPEQAQKVEERVSALKDADILANFLPYGFEKEDQMSDRAALDKVMKSDMSDEAKQKVLEDYVDIYGENPYANGVGDEFSGTAGQKTDDEIVLDVDAILKDRYKNSTILNEGKVVTVTNTTDVSQFGKANGTGAGGKQDGLVEDYINAAKLGTLKVGDICNFNYGFGIPLTYMYMGDNKFVKIKLRTLNVEVANPNESKYYTSEDGSITLK